MRVALLHCAPLPPPPPPIYGDSDKARRITEKVLERQRIEEEQRRASREERRQQIECLEFQWLSKMHDQRTKRLGRNSKRYKRARNNGATVGEKYGVKKQLPRYGAYDKCEDYRVPFANSKYYDQRLGDLARSDPFWLRTMNTKRIGGSFGMAIKDICAKLTVEAERVSMKCEDFVMPFGKHSGKTLGDILAEDASYLDWLQNCEIRNPALKTAIDEMNEKYSAEIEKALRD